MLPTSETPWAATRLGQRLKTRLRTSPFYHRAGNGSIRQYPTCRGTIPHKKREALRPKTEGPHRRTPSMPVLAIGRGDVHAPRSPCGRFTGPATGEPRESHLPYTPEQHRCAAITVVYRFLTLAAAVRARPGSAILRRASPGRRRRTPCLISRTSSTRRRAAWPTSP